MTITKSLNLKNQLEIIKSLKLKDSMTQKTFQNLLRGRLLICPPIRKPRHRITITIAPPPQRRLPQLPEKNPIQSAKVNSNFADFDRESSDSSEDDEYSYVSKEESVDEPKSVPSKNGNTNIGKQNDGTIRPVLVNNNYIPSNRSNTIARHQYGISQNRPNKASWSLENARNARKNRLAKSIDASYNDKKKKTETSNSKAEIASNLRRTRLQQQKAKPR